MLKGLLSTLRLFSTSRTPKPISRSGFPSSESAILLVLEMRSSRPTQRCPVLTLADSILLSGNGRRGMSVLAYVACLARANLGKAGSRPTSLGTRAHLLVARALRQVSARPQSASMHISRRGERRCPSVRSRSRYRLPPLPGGIRIPILILPAASPPAPPAACGSSLSTLARCSDRPGVIHAPHTHRMPFQS